MTTARRMESAKMALSGIKLEYDSSVEFFGLLALLGRETITLGYRLEKKKSSASEIIHGRFYNH